MRIVLSNPISLEKIEKISNNQDLTHFNIKAITTDSRLARPDDLFVSLAKNDQDSVNHIREAEQRGAVTLGRYGTVHSPDPAGSLLSIAMHYRSSLSSLRHTVAITGSVGKTTTKEFASNILSASYPTHHSDANMNNRIGVALSILSAPKETEVLVLEVGTNHPGEIAEISSCIQPDIALITFIGTSHIGNFGSREEIAREKLSIHTQSNKCTLIRPYAEPLLEGIASSLTFGRNVVEADYSLNTLNDCLYTFRAANDESYPFGFEFKDPHLLHDLTAALAISHLCEIKTSELCRGVVLITANDLRHRITECGNYSILNDSYNASYESVAAALKMLKANKATFHSALFGDVLELGEYSAEIHERIGELAAESELDTLYVVGEYCEYIAKGALKKGMPKGKVSIIGKAVSESDIASIIKNNMRDAEMLLVKGSHASGIHRVAKLLIGDTND